jgi:hypothetical protein
MRRKTRTCRQQVMLFPTVVQNETVPTEVKDEVVRALADLLLEALKVETGTEGGSDDEHEGHA